MALPLAAVPVAISAGSKIVGAIKGLTGGSDETFGCPNRGRYNGSSVASAIADPARRQEIADVMANEWPSWTQYRGLVLAGNPNARVRSGTITIADWLVEIASGETGEGCSSGDRKMDQLLARIAPLSGAASSPYTSPPLSPSSTVPLTTAVSAPATVLPSWWPFAAIGGLVLILVVVLVARK